MFILRAYYLSKYYCNVLARNDHSYFYLKNKKTIEDKLFYGLKNYTNSITTISAASPRRGPTFKIRVYPPLRPA